MQRDSRKDIGQVIKAHTTETSLDELRARGKKRVRVVSGQRVMEIIQAVVDDTISREVGEITQRDRDRIVQETRGRFDRVLGLQTDLETKVADLRQQLRDADLERESLRCDKSLLESRLESASAPAAEPEALQRLARDVTRMRETLETVQRRLATVDEAAVSRLGERLAARDEQHERLLSAEMKDVRRRLEALGRDTAKAQDAVGATLMRNVESQRAVADRALTERLDREFTEVRERIDELRVRTAPEPVAADVGRLRGELDALESRLRSVETSSSQLAEELAGELADELANRLFPRVEERAAALHRELGSEMRGHVEGLASSVLVLEETLANDRRVASIALDSVRSAVEETRRVAEAVADSVRAESAGRADDGTRGEIEAVREALLGLDRRVAAIDDRSSNWVEAAAQRVAEQVVVDEDALRDAVTRVAARVDDRIDEIVESVRDANAARAADLATIGGRLGVLESKRDESRTAKRAADHAVGETLADHGTILMRIEARAGDDHAAIRELTAEASADRLALRELTAAAAQERAILRQTIDAAMDETGQRTTEAVDVLRAEMGDRQDALLAAIHDGLSRVDTQVSGIAERQAELQTELRAGRQADPAAAAASASAIAELRADLEARHDVVPEALRDLIGGLREEIAAVADRTAAARSALEVRVESSIESLRGELAALAARSSDAEERHAAALREIGERIAEAATSQAASLGSTFEGALDNALDQITRTMERATARPIDITVEATDVLLDKIFDAGEHEMVSNLNDLDVEERSASGVGKTLGRLRALHAPGKTGTDH